MRHVISCFRFLANYKKAQREPSHNYNLTNISPLLSQATVATPGSQSFHNCL